MPVIFFSVNAWLRLSADQLPFDTLIAEDSLEEFRSNINNAEKTIIKAVIVTYWIINSAKCMRYL